MILNTSSAALKFTGGLMLGILVGAWASVLLAGSAEAADAIAGEDSCNGTVVAIEFSGNRVTHPSVMLRELPQRIDQPCSLDAVIDGIQSLQDLGLFTQVIARFEPADEGVVLYYQVKEKYFFFAIPRLSRTSDGELRYGLQLRWDNFAGRLHQLKVTAERREAEDGAGPASFVNRGVYSVPRFLDTRLGLALAVANDRRELEILQEGARIGQANERSRRLGWQVSRWLNRNDGTFGLRVFGGMAVERRSLEDLNGQRGAHQDGMAVAVGVGFENNRVHSESFRRTGSVYGAQLSSAGSHTGSDFSYTRVEGWWRHYRALSGGLRNLNLQLRLGLSDGAAFGEQAFAIGGGEVLRGMEPGEVQGDLMAVLNVELLTAVFAWPQWRWVIFTDLGSVLERDDPDSRALEARGGLGLRYKFQSITNTDLRLDVAWNPDTGRPMTYLSTDVTF